MRLDDLDEMEEDVFWGAIRIQREEKDLDRRHIGELVRGAALRLFNLQVRKQDRIRDPRKFWPMPWDDSKEERAQAAAEQLQGMSRGERRGAQAESLERIEYDGEQEPENKSDG